MKKKMKKKIGGKYQQSNRGRERNKQPKEGGKKQEERENLCWGLCHPSPRQSASVSHSFFFLVYFSDAWFVCHHPISKHNTHPQSSSSASSPAGIWQKNKEKHLTGLCLCVCVLPLCGGGIGGGGGAGIRSMG